MLLPYPKGDYMVQLNFAIYNDWLVNVKAFVKIIDWSVVCVCVDMYLNAAKVVNFLEQVCALRHYVYRWKQYIYESSTVEIVFFITLTIANFTRFLAVLNQTLYNFLIKSMHFK